MFTNLIAEPMPPSLPLPSGERHAQGDRASLLMEQCSRRDSSQTEEPAERPTDGWTTGAHDPNKCNSGQSADGLIQLEIKGWRNRKAPKPSASAATT